MHSHNNILLFRCHHFSIYTKWNERLFEEMYGECHFATGLFPSWELNSHIFYPKNCEQQLRMKLEGLTRTQQKVGIKENYGSLTTM